jgi:hypothetical protein
MYEPRYHLIDRTLDLIVASAKTFIEILDMLETKRFSDNYYVYDSLTGNKYYYKNIF